MPARRSSTRWAASSNSARSSSRERSFATSAPQACSAGPMRPKSSRSAPAPAPATATSAVPPKSSTAGVSSASVIETPSKPSRSRSSPVAIARVKAAGRSEKAGEVAGLGIVSLPPAGGAVGEGGVGRGAEHGQLASGGGESFVGPLADRPQLALGEVDPFGREVGVFGCRPETGEVLAVRRHAARLQSVGEGDPGRFDSRRRGAEAAFGLIDDAIRTPDVEHGREVDVDAEIAQAGGGRPPLAGAEGGAAGAHLLGRSGRRAAEALHLTALLVDHHQQRVAQLRRPLYRLQPGDQAPAGSPAGEVDG